MTGPQTPSGVSGHPQSRVGLTVPSVFVSQRGDVEFGDTLVTRRDILADDDFDRMITDQAGLRCAVDFQFQRFSDVQDDPECSGYRHPLGMRWLRDEMANPESPVVEPGQ